MIYYKCPTCGREISTRQVKYDEGLKKINETNMSKKEKDVLKSGLINSLKLKKNCCKLRVMMKHDLINILQPSIY